MKKMVFIDIKSASLLLPQKDERALKDDVEGILVSESMTGVRVILKQKTAQNQE